MDRIAQAPQEERAELFRRSAGLLRPERSPAIIEKDFWVCWASAPNCLSFLIRMLYHDGSNSFSRRDAVARVGRALLPVATNPTGKSARPTA
jgi:hypothetical protein